MAESSNTNNEEFIEVSGVRISRIENLRQKSDGKNEFCVLVDFVVENDSGPHFKVVEDFDFFVILLFSPFHFSFFP
jgi:hypothetical protein